MTQPRGKYALLRTVSAAVALQIAACVSAWACDGQAGKVIFEDTFTDDSGGWDLTPPESSINPPDFLFTIDNKYVAMSALNLTFRTTDGDGDFCMEVILPKAIAPDNQPAAGIEFWATDYNNLMMALLWGDGSVQLFSRTGAPTWQTIFTVPSGPAFKSDPEAVNALRVVAKDGRITLYLNGTQIKAPIRAQVPDGNLRFGMLGQYQKPTDAPPAIRVKSFKVTAGE